MRLPGAVCGNRRPRTQNYDYESLIYSAATNGASGTGRFYKGSSYGAAGAETGTSGYDPINSVTLGAGQNTRSKYVVQSGDTLAGIAQQVWGDASLWYLIADANGLSADSMLTVGQALSLPLKGPSNSSNAGMFRPYDTASAVGDLSPTSVKPPKKGKCGAFGQILLVAIAVAVTAVTAGAAVAAIGPASGILGGLGSLFSGSLGFGAGVAIGAGSAAIGSIVSQGVGVATGIQPTFSWKGVALAALAGGISGGISAVPGLQGGGIFGAAARGAGSSALTQGIGVVTGLQDKFDWAGVAAAGASFGLAKVFNVPSLIDDHSLGNQFANAGVSMAGAIANAATRSVINGSDFGDNIMAALPDVLGNTIGDLLTYGLSGRATSAAPAGTGDGVDAAPTTGEDGGQVGDSQGTLPILAAGLEVSAVPIDPLQLEAERFGQEMEKFLNSLPDPLAPLPEPAVPAKFDPAHSELQANPAQLLADGTILVTAVSPKSPATDRTIQLTSADVINIKKTLQTEWVPWAGENQAKGIVDTILNRLASGHFGSSVSDVVNQRNQFSDINGPPARKHGRHSVQEFPMKLVTNKTSSFVDQYLAERAAGAPSSVGTHLNYANPNPLFSDPKNLPWINALDGPRYGVAPLAMHYHGTTPENQPYRPKPYRIVLP